MNVIEGKEVSTAASMLKSVDNLFTKFNLKRDSVNAIGVDNTNSNIGQRNSIASRTREINKDIVIAGCPCHIMHNTDSKAAIAFTSVFGFDFDDHCVDLFFWFDKSTKRKDLL